MARTKSLGQRASEGALFEDVRLWLDDPATVPDDSCQTVDGDHGRIETRRALVAHDVAWLAERHAFPSLAAVAKVTTTREIEDRSRARKDHAPKHLARLRRFALNLLRANRDQGSTRGKIKRAGWDDAFLLQLLAA